VGQLSIDGQGDIVAVIIAPGNSLTGQQRELAVNNIANYLENDNQDGDLSFVSALPGVDPNILIDTFNDKVIALTRQELMSVVEKRVLSEVAQSLENYRNDPDRDNIDFDGIDNDGDGNLIDDDPNCAVPPFNCDNAYPWLAPFADPSTSTYLWTINTFAGHLPIHIPAQAYANVSLFTVNWSGLPVAAVPITAGIPPSVACLSDANCIDLFGNVRNVITPLTTVTCFWQNRYSFSCTGTDNSVTSPLLIRTYTIVYVDNGANNPTFNPPTAALPRSRNITVNGVLAGNLTITISDTGANVGSTSFTFPAGTELTSLTISGVDYHIDANGVDLTADGDVNDVGEQGDLPDWFRNNNWHHQVYVAYPTGEPLPGATAPGVICVPGGAPACLTLTSNGINPGNNIRAIAVIAGQGLAGKVIPGPDSRPTDVPPPVPPVVLSDYLDGINLVPFTTIYDQQLSSTVFNDQVRIIRTTTTLPP